MHILWYGDDIHRQIYIAKGVVSHAMWRKKGKLRWWSTDKKHSGKINFVVWSTNLGEREQVKGGRKINFFHVRAKGDEKQIFSIFPFHLFHFARQHRRHCFRNIHHSFFFTFAISFTIHCGFVVDMKLLSSFAVIRAILSSYMWKRARGNKSDRPQTYALP